MMSMDAIDSVGLLQTTKPRDNPAKRLSNVLPLLEFTNTIKIPKRRKNPAPNWGIRNIENLFMDICGKRKFRLKTDMQT